MPISRPDRPLDSKGADRRGRTGDHPDRAADLQERADGAHAEQLADPAAGDGVNTPGGDGVNTPAGDGVNTPAGDGVNTPGGDGVGTPGAGNSSAEDAARDGAAGGPEAVNDPGNRGHAPGGSPLAADPGPPARPSGRALTLAVVGVLLVVGLIYLTMIGGVFAVD